MKFEQSNHPLVSQALEVVGAYIAWIDITLIANDRFVRWSIMFHMLICTLIPFYLCSLLLKYLSNPNLRESSADCLHEIVSKGTFFT